MSTAIRPLQHLADTQAAWPGLWRELDQFRAKARAGGLTWPAWCWMPLAGFGTVMSHGQPWDLDLAQRLGIVAALATWRVTQGIYRFDRDIAEALVDTPLTGDLPHELFFRLPEWCCYVDMPAGLWDASQHHGLVLYGFYVFLESDSHTHQAELRYVLDADLPYDQDWRASYAQGIVHLGRGSLEDGIREAQNQGAQLVGDNRLVEPWLIDLLENVLRPCVNLTLYLCATGAELRRRDDPAATPTRPPPTQTKHGPRFFPPSQPRAWDVAWRMGAALRGAQQRQEAEVTTPTGHHARPKAHARRAHWHAYWTGRRLDGAPGERLVLRWLHTMLVGGTPEDLIPTIHPVTPTHEEERSHDPRETY